MIIIQVLILAVIGAMIGWITNIIAIKLIFRPLKPITIPIINVKIQGLIPKRRQEMAKSIGQVVEEELVSVNEIIDKVIEQENLSNIMFIIKRKINGIIDEKLPSIIPSTFKNMIFNYVNEMVDSEGERILKDLIEKMVHKATNEVRLSEMIEEKINSFELEKIESIIISIAKRELKHIEILGGILGFLIGIIQGMLIILF
ncbi:membrane protein [Caloranaerobacter azorensis H53214]|uniref:DUF445 domain-containing protein n=2 Tax=Caloranaerobacter azorensis TaxID=116090 RepID=A0A1M5VYA1_9FIRM|nr:DUF445 family protein [Caloranaerobacter azorensis]KGG79704.1 membrane protein [Caloranaerobacter azorensis H53214]SHH79903.1 Protein of unknown function [Caloranaerobacter azorensis DSM 13643]